MLKKYIGEYKMVHEIAEFSPSYNVNININMFVVAMFDG